MALSCPPSVRMWRKQSLSVVRCALGTPLLNVSSLPGTDISAIRSGESFVLMTRLRVITPRHEVELKNTQENNNSK